MDVKSCRISDELIAVLVADSKHYIIVKEILSFCHEFLIAHRVSDIIIIIIIIYDIYIAPVSANMLLTGTLQSNRIAISKGFHTN